MFYLNITGQMSPEEEKDLSRLVKIRYKANLLDIYCCQVEIEGSPKEIKDAYTKLFSKLIKKPYIRKIEKSAELELLNA